jgi:hypothetical protein
MLDSWRPLRLVLDDATLTDDEIALFATFGEDDELELWHTRADLGAHLEIGDEFETPFPMGGARSVHAVSPESGTLFGIYGVERLRQRSGEIAAAAAEAEDDVFAALAFAAASDEMDADGFVTRRVYVLDRHHYTDPVAFVPEDAFRPDRTHPASAGKLVARPRHDGLAARRKHLPLRARARLLRDAWPWFSAIVSSGTQNNDRSLVYLGQTARERFTRVLQIRDRLHFAAKGEPTRARGDEVVFQLETLLMFLSAAFDAAARVAHVVYFGSDYSTAGWRRERWRERLRQVEPVLAALADEGTHGGAILQMVGALRNTIHGEGLRSGEIRESGQRPAQLVRVTEKEGERLTRLLEHIRADPAVWGMEKRRDEVWLAADRFVEALVPEATALLNQLLAKTDARRLPGAAGAAVARLVDDPSPEWWRDMLSFEIRQRVRLLSGM